MKGKENILFSVWLDANRLVYYIIISIYITVPNILNILLHRHFYYNSNYLLLQIDEPNMKSYDRRNWQILDYSLIFQTKTYDCCEELYTNALITLKIARNAPAQQWFFKIMLFGEHLLCRDFHLQ